MNDLVSVILIVMESDEVATFWCFKGLMDRMVRNATMCQKESHSRIRSLTRS